MVKIGIVGAGRNARMHTRALAGLEAAQIVAVYDALPERADLLAGETGAIACRDFRTLVDQVEAVWFCSPPSTRREQVEVAAAAGRHIMAEKPIATTHDDGAAIVAAVERARVKAIVDFNIRFSWAGRALKALVDSGELGQIVSYWTLAIAGDLDPTNWRRDPRFVCGFTIEAMCHHVDQVQWIVAPVAAVAGITAATVSTLPAFDNTVAAILHLGNGAMAVMHGSCEAVTHAHQRGLLGTDGTAVLERDPAGGNRIRWRRNGMAEDQFVTAAEPEFDAGYRNMARHFLDCIRDDRPPSPSLRDGLAVLDVTLAILDAARERRVVSIAPALVPA